MPALRRFELVAGDGLQFVRSEAALAAMRALWVDAGSDPNMAKIAARQIRRVYFAAAVYSDNAKTYVPNPRLLPPYLFGADGRGGWREAIGSVGIYRAGNWTPGYNEHDLAAQLDADLIRVGADNRQCAVHANFEAHAFDLEAFLHYWRQLRPHRETSWVIEGMQGGRLTKAQVSAINADENLTVFAESFYDAGGQSMLPLSPDRVRCDLIDYGIQRQRALVMYDAAALDDRWDGCAFTQGRVP